MDFKKQTIGLLGKNKKRRYVPLNKEALMALKDWKQQSNSKTLVFCNPDGSPLTTVRRKWLDILHKADIKMTLRYAHLAPKHKSLAVSKLPSIMK